VGPFALAEPKEAESLAVDQQTADQQARDLQRSLAERGDEESRHLGFLIRELCGIIDAQIEASRTSVAMWGRARLLLGELEEKVGGTGL